MKEHVSSSHRVKAAEHKTRPLWKECTLQTYFTQKGRIDYFVVVDNNKKGEKSNAQELSALLKREETALFTKLEEDYQEGVRRDIEEQASTVHDFADSRSERRHVARPQDDAAAGQHPERVLRRGVWEGGRVPALQEPVDARQVLHHYEAAPGLLLPRGALRGRPLYTGHARLGAAEGSHAADEAADLGHRRDSGGPSHRGCRRGRAGPEARDPATLPGPYLSHGRQRAVPIAYPELLRYAKQEGQGGPQAGPRIVGGAGELQQLPVCPNGEGPNPDGVVEAEGRPRPRGLQGLVALAPRQFRAPRGRRARPPPTDPGEAAATSTRAAVSDVVQHCAAALYADVGEAGHACLPSQGLHPRVGPALQDGAMAADRGVDNQGEVCSEGAGQLRRGGWHRRRCRGRAGPRCPSRAQQPQLLHLQPCLCQDNDAHDEHAAPLELPSLGELAGPLLVRSHPLREASAGGLRDTLAADARRVEGRGRIPGQT
ncbi:hypothetical protein V492_00584 [Pseudogymnoascus sp. VKM F-4246]|nr:hypothetical protein V492_00584 [Pseudogymnoascus sp. VKM F-4246]